MANPITLIIPAAGSAQRMQQSLAKQFICVGGKTLLRHSVEAFSSFPIAQCIIAVSKDNIDLVSKEFCHFAMPITVIEGGETRLKSVKNAVMMAGDTPYCLIHDAARPTVSMSLICRVVDALKTHSIVVPGLGLSDTIKQVKDGQVVKTLDRNKLIAAQTPQGFHTELLKSMYDQFDDSQEATDEASLAESLGYRVNVVRGCHHTIKVTYPTDLEWVKLYLKHVDGKN